MAPAAFAATSWPLTIENCGVTQTFAQAPQRVVTVGQHETELLLALGLEKTIAATSVWFGELPAPLADAGKNLPRLTENSPSFEAVVGDRNRSSFSRSITGTLVRREKWEHVSSLHRCE